MENNSPIVNWITSDVERLDWSDSSIIDFVDFVTEGDLNIIPIMSEQPIQPSEENSLANDTLTNDIITDNSVVSQVNRLDRVFCDITNTSHVEPIERRENAPNITWNPDQWWINFIRENSHNS